jgi:hypothetical protein
MSERYPGGIITKNPATPTGPFENGSAPGVWTLEQQMQFKQQGVWPTAGLQPNYIEDVFSTYLYTGNGSTQTITNGIDLSTKGGLVWLKSRSGAENHILTDSARGVAFFLRSNLTNAQDTNSPSLISAFNNNGFGLGVGYAGINGSGESLVSWTFREQPKFFDVVTYTGNGATARAINHNLGSTPGCMFVKRTDAASDWRVYHRGCSTDNGLVLNDTAAQTTSAIYWFGNEVNVIPPTSTQFTVNAGFTNINNGTYVAYLFAHDAGGFGLTGTDNVISCGGYTGTGSTAQNITLGYEPQWVMIKRTDTTDQWVMVDNMRGFFRTADNALCANTANAEAADVSVSGAMQPIATGFTLFNANSSVNASGGTYIYVAIRRGPMKVPTTGTSVFTPSIRAGTGATATTSNLSFPPDMVWSKGRDNGGTNSGDFDRLRGATRQLSLNQSDSEATASTSLTGFDVMTGYAAGADAVQLTINATGYNYVNWQFRRAPSFFDEVCYTGTGVAGRTVTHNLTVTPEIIIVKKRSASEFWGFLNVATSSTGALNSDAGLSTSNNQYYFGNDTIYVAPTSSVFTVGSVDRVNILNGTYVAYLFATCAGVSKVGSYSGSTGNTVTVPCGFTAGTRFVLIKRTDSTGDWYVWDSARGIIPGNDPYLLLNSTAVEVTGTDYVDTAASGFEISSTAPAAINANGGTFIFLAIA